MTKAGTSQLQGLNGALLAAWCGQNWEGGIPGAVRGLSNDTRTLQRGDVYIALKGEHFDGHDFVAEAFEKGAQGAIVDRQWSSAHGPCTGPLLRVDAPVQALAELAKAYRYAVNPLVIAVTGSAGKTTVKELVAAMLQRTRHTASTKGNWNNEIGLPLSMLAMDPRSEVGVFEVGTNHPGEIARLCAILEPEWGVVTNVGTAHIEFFGSVDAIADEKAALLTALPESGCAFINRAGGGGERLVRNCAARCRTVGVSPPADYVWTRADSVSALTIRDTRTNETRTLPCPLPGRHNAANTSQAVAVAREAGTGWDEIEASLSTFRALPMRWETHVIGDMEIVNDAYNANPESMHAAIDAFLEIYAGRECWLVLGAMLELGGVSDEAHASLGRYLQGLDWSGLITVGDAARVIGGSALERGPSRRVVFRCRDVHEAAALLTDKAPERAAVLLKASRGCRLEKILEQVRERRGAGT